MRHRDSKYELKEYIGLDEGFFETTDVELTRKIMKPGKAGEALYKHLLVAVESIPEGNKKDGMALKATASKIVKQHCYKFNGRYFG